MAILGGLGFWLNRQFLDNNGDPLANGSLVFKAAGTTNDKDTFTTSDISAGTGTPNANPLNLDANGRATWFVEPGAYDISVYDAADGGGNLQYTIPAVEDVGLTNIAELGITLATGATSVTSGYTVLDTDQLVTVDSTGGANPCIINLPAVAGRGLPIGIKNLGTIALAVTPNGTDTIETINAAFTVAAASSPTFPTIWLVPNGTTGWLIVASHGL